MSDAAGAPTSTDTEGVEEATSPMPVAEARPVAATWQSRPAESAWCPDALREALPWAREVAYADVESHEGRSGFDGGDGQWQVLATTLRGRVHAHEGTHREDAVAIVTARDGFALAAADGAGSSRWSRIGAASVCRSVASAARALLASPRTIGADEARGALVEALCVASDELRAAAATAEGAARDFRTTVLVAICIGDTLLALQVGDGAIIVRERDGSIRRLGKADSGDYSGEVSAFFPEVDRAALSARVTVSTVRGVDAILAVTDGIEDPFYPIERHGTTIFRQLYEGVEAPADGFVAQRSHGPVVGEAHAVSRLRDWIAFERRGENDDRTLAGAFRLPTATGE